MDLDLQVAKAVMAVKLLERALHDVGPWYVVVDDACGAPAVRTITDEGVTFTARLPIPSPEGTIALACRDEIVSVREVGAMAAGQTVVWSLTAAVALA